MISTFTSTPAHTSSVSPRRRHLGEPGPDLRERQLGEQAAGRVGVVADDQRPVARAVDVELDAVRTELQGPGEGRNGVLGGQAVGASMRQDERHVEGCYDEVENRGLGTKKMRNSWSGPCGGHQRVNSLDPRG